MKRRYEQNAPKLPTVGLNGNSHQRRIKRRLVQAIVRLRQVKREAA